MTFIKNLDFGLKVKKDFTLNFIVRELIRKAVANINSVFDIEGATNANVVHFFKTLRSGDFDLFIEPRDRPKT